MWCWRRIATHRRASQEDPPTASSGCTIPTVKPSSWPAPTAKPRSEVWVDHQPTESGAIRAPLVLKSHTTGPNGRETGTEGAEIAPDERSAGDHHGAADEPVRVVRWVPAPRRSGNGFARSTR